MFFSTVVSILDADIVVSFHKSIYSLQVSGTPDPTNIARNGRREASDTFAISAESRVLYSYYFKVLETRSRGRV